MSWYLLNLSWPLVRTLPALAGEGKSTNVALHVNAVIRCRFMGILTLAFIFFQEDIGVGGVLGLLWFQRRYVYTICTYVHFSLIC